MINQQFKALGRKYQVLPKFRDLLQGAREAKSSEVFAHSCAVSALSGQRIPHQPFENLETVLNTLFDVMNIVLSVEGKPSSDDVTTHVTRSLSILALQAQLTANLTTHTHL